MNGLSKRALNKDLRFAVKSGDDSVICVLAAAGANICQKDSGGNTLLHWAVHNGNTNVVRLLLSLGANPLIFDRDGMLPLHWAAEEKQDASASALIDYMDDVNIKSKVNGWSALHIAAWRGRDSIMRSLISKGADIDAQDIEGVTPLHIAIIVANISSVRILVDSGASVEIADLHGRTAKDFLCKIAEHKNYDKICKIIL